jgi:hypothetical protein
MLGKYLYDLFIDPFLNPAGDPKFNNINLQRSYKRGPIHC